MAWSTVYLVLAILVAVLGIWNIARRRSVFLSLIGDSASAFLGYRLVEGGADNDEVYSFAAFHSAVAGFSWRF